MKVCYKFQLFPKIISLTFGLSTFFLGYNFISTNCNLEFGIPFNHLFD